MHKLAASYIIIFMLFAYFSAVLEGGGAMVAQPTTIAIESGDNTITVQSTVGFIRPVSGFSSPTIMLGNDDVKYTGLTGTTFTGCSGITEDHSIGSMVYTTDIGVLNKIFGFNIAATDDAYTEVSAVSMATNFFTTALGYLASFNFSLLTGDMIYVRYLLMAPAAGFVIYFAVIAASTLIGIISRVL